VATTSAAAIAMLALISVTSASVANIWRSVGALEVALGDRDRAREQQRSSARR
jgi:hypothetical protein